LEVSYAAWSTIATDFITQRSESHRKTQAMVVVDLFTKRANSLAIYATATAKDVTDTCLPDVGKPHGLPTTVVSDMDAKFSGKPRALLCKML